MNNTLWSNRFSVYLKQMVRTERSSFMTSTFASRRKPVSKFANALCYETIIPRKPLVHEIREPSMVSSDLTNIWIHYSCNKVIKKIFSCSLPAFTFDFYTHTPIFSVSCNIHILACLPSYLFRFSEVLDTPITQFRCSLASCAGVSLPEAPSFPLSVASLIK